jgi:hypothetical protein
MKCVSGGRQHTFRYPVRRYGAQLAGYRRPISLYILIPTNLVSIDADGNHPRATRHVAFTELPVHDFGGPPAGDLLFLVDFCPNLGFNPGEETVSTGRRGELGEGDHGTVFFRCCVLRASPQ